MFTSKTALISIVDGLYNLFMLFLFSPINEISIPIVQQTVDTPILLITLISATAFLVNLGLDIYSGKNFPHTSQLEVGVILNDCRSSCIHYFAKLSLNSTQLNSN